MTEVLRLHGTCLLHAEVSSLNRDSLGAASILVLSGYTTWAVDDGAAASGPRLLHRSRPRCGRRFQDRRS